MSWTVDSALLEDSLVVDPREMLGSYEFRVGDLETEIRVRLYRRPGAAGVFFTQSHYIHTPVQAGPYCPSRAWGDDPGYALHQAVASVTSYYADAVRAGHAPAESWLVPNIHFG